MSFLLPRSFLSVTCKRTLQSFPPVPEPSQVHRRVRPGIAFASVLIGPVTASLSWKARYSQVQGHGHGHGRAATSEMETVDTSSRLSELRKLMRDRNIDIYGPSSPNSPHAVSAALDR